MPNLYELAEEFAMLRKAAANEELTDEELTAVLDELDESRIDLRTKVDNICRLLANLGSDAEAVHREERRLSARRKALENKVERLRDWVRVTMEVMEVPKITTDTHTISLQEGGPTVVVTDERAIPDAYVKVTRTPNKTGIMATYKTTGEIPPGVDIVKGKTKLVIR